MAYAIVGSFVVSAFYLTFSSDSAEPDVHQNPLQYISSERYV